MCHNHYKSLFNSVQDVSDKPDVLPYIQNNMTNKNFDFNVSIVSDAIMNFPNDKLPGIDGLTAEHLKNASYRLNVVLSVVLQAMLKHGFFSKQLIIVPILNSKNGDPIALVTVCSKIREIFIVKQMSKYSWTTDCQFAYKKGHSTEMCIILLKEFIRYNYNHKPPVYVCFLDTSKAFNCINYSKLFQILIERKCPSYILKVLVFGYQQQMLCIKWNWALSECFFCICI